MKKQRQWSIEARRRHREGVERYQERRREVKSIENITTMVWNTAEKIGENPDDVLRGLCYMIMLNEEPCDKRSFKEKISTMKELMKCGELEDPLFTIKENKKTPDAASAAA